MKHVCALLALTLGSLSPALADDVPLKLAALSPADASAATGAARQLDLGDFDTIAPNGAQTLQVGYEIYLGGLHLATIEMVGFVDKGHYVAASQMTTKGLADAFANSDAQVVSTGDVQDHLVLPHTYNSDVKSPGKRQLVGLTFDKGMPRPADANPTYDLSRFPVTDEQKLNTVDPVSAAMFVTLGSSANAADKCGRVVPVFDGKRRYNLTFKFLNDDTVSLGRDSFNGGKPVPAYHCQVTYERVAGFKPSKKPLKVPPLDVWMAPFPGTDFMVPVRLQASTEFGGIIARATRLKATPAAS